MRSGTIIVFRDDSERPYSEVALGNGDRVLIALDHGGLTITQIVSPDNRNILFQATPNTVSHICAGLVSSPNTSKATPLQVLVAAVVQLESSDDLRRAFQHAAEQVF